MTSAQPAALATARTYFEAMANKDIDTLMTVVSDAITVSSPVGELTGSGAFRGFQDGFAKMIKTLTLLASFGDDEHAVIVYRADTNPVPLAMVAEHLRVANGKVTAVTVIYDSAPFAEYMKTVPQH